MLRVVKKLITPLTLLLALTTALPASAMGSGNPYEDAQVGLNYVVYQPNYTAALTLKSFQLAPCGVGHDESVYASYGSGKKYFSLTESSAKNICPMNMMLIRGATRTVLNKPAVGQLAGTQLVVISVGIPRSQINSIFSHLKPLYKAPVTKK